MSGLVVFGCVLVGGIFGLTAWVVWLDHKEAMARIAADKSGERA